MPTIAMLKEWGQKVLGTIPVLRLALSNNGISDPATEAALRTLDSVGDELVDEGEKSAKITSTIPETSAPVVSSLQPSLGPAIGGTIVTIKGSGLSDVSTVNFGSQTGTELVLKSDSEISVKSPRGLPETSVDVSVITPKGVSLVVPGLAFSYT